MEKLNRMELTSLEFCRKGVKSKNVWDQECLNGGMDLIGVWSEMRMRIWRDGVGGKLGLGVRVYEGPFISG